jgi:hypothetical protein
MDSCNIGPRSSPAHRPEKQHSDDLPFLEFTAIVIPQRPVSESLPPTHGDADDEIRRYDHLNPLFQFRVLNAVVINASYHENGR